MSAPVPSPVVLATDFGAASPYVGQMKLVMEQITPGLRTIDLAHDLPPQNLMAAAVVLSGATRFLPRPCVVCAVIDPGVGSARRILAATFGCQSVQVLVPDNGLLDAFREWGQPSRIHVVERPEYFLPYVSPVFHGRDVFAPIAARLATGLPIKDLGPACAEPPRRLDWPEPVADPAGARGRIVYVDRFGNCVTNLPATCVPTNRTARIRVAGLDLPLHTHYAEVRPGEALALAGSFGLLELAVREGSVAERIGRENGPRAALDAEVNVYWGRTGEYIRGENAEDITSE